MKLSPCLLAVVLLSSPLAVCSAQYPRIFASSNQSFAQGLTNAGADSIRETRKVIYFEEDLSDLVLGYANYYIGSTGENNTGHGNVNVSFGLEYQGSYYPFYVNGARVFLCADGATFKTDPLQVSIVKGTYGAIRTREVKVSPGATNSWLWSTDGGPAFNEGWVVHSSSTRDWTLGGAPGESASLSWTIDAAGKVTPTMVNRGSGITTTGVTIAILDSNRAGSGFSYIATVSNGSLSSWYTQNGGTGYSSDIFVGPTAMGGYGAGGPKQTFGPSVIAGTPTTVKESVLLLGDSISAGYGSSDGRGDTRRNFGIYARAMSKKYNVCNAAIPGLTAYACDYRYSRTRRLIQSILNPQIVLICLGTNDVDQRINDSGSKTVVNALKGHLTNIATWWSTNCDSKVWIGTILPRVTISNGVQTPKTGFTSGSDADQVNSAIRAGSLISGAVVIDGRALVQDPANNSLWRTDHGALTTDGTHPNDAPGIPWIAANISMPAPQPVFVTQDNADSSGVLISGTWTIGTGVPGYYGANYIFHGAGAGSVRFTPTLPVAGNYQVYLRWTAASNRVTVAPITITYNGGSAVVNVDQTQNNGMWMLLGTYPFLAGASGSVLVNCAGASPVGNAVVADAVQYVLQ